MQLHGPSLCVLCDDTVIRPLADAGIDTVIRPLADAGRDTLIRPLADSDQLTRDC